MQKKKKKSVKFVLTILCIFLWASQTEGVIKFQRQFLSRYFSLQLVISADKRSESNACDAGGLTLTNGNLGEFYVGIGHGNRVTYGVVESPFFLSEGEFTLLNPRLRICFFTFQHISASYYLILILISQFFCILLLLFENFQIEVDQLHFVCFPATFQKLLKLVIFSKLFS